MADTFVSHTLGEVRFVDIQLLTIRQMAALYNELKEDGAVPVLDFKSSLHGYVAVKRAWLRRLGGPPVRIKHPEEEARAEKFNHPPRGNFRRILKGSRRHQLAMALTEGATVEECMAITGWKYNQILSEIEHLWRYCGYGLREEDGKIYLYT